MFRMQTVSLFVLLLPFVFSGCGKSAGIEEYSVSGVVNYEGNPIEKGRILFREQGGQERGFSSEIKNGQYAVKVAPGQMRVEITASRLIPGKFENVNGTPEQVGEMYIPSNYNKESELTAEVKSDGTNRYDFDLK